MGERVRWIDAKKASELCGLKVNTIYVLRLQGRFAPGYKIGRLVRFSEDEVFEWMEKHKVKRGE